MHFAVELYLHRQPESQSALVDRARSAAGSTRSGRAQVTFLRSIYLPGDEICFLVFEARSAEAVAEAAADEGIVFERIVETRFLPDISPSGEVAPRTAKEARR